MEERIVKNKKYFVAQINSSKAFQMTSQYHYSGLGFKKAKINLGVFNNETNELVGVLQWGISAQEGIRLDRYVKEPITKEEYLELNRFCMADSEGRNSESTAIGLGVKWIRKYAPEIKLLVSYAGRKEGNYGYIYQATNWEYLGYFVSPGFWFLDGQERHMLTLYYLNKKYGDPNKGFIENICSMYQDVRQTWTKQFIYIIRLDDTLTPASDILPYPKQSNEYPIKTKEKIFIQNDEVFNQGQTKVEKEKVKFYYNPNELLFSRKTLQRHKDTLSDEIREKIFRKKVAMYDIAGTFEKLYDSCTEIEREYPEYLTNSIREAARNNAAYKNKYFRYIGHDELPEDQLSDIKPLCSIEGILYYTSKEIEKELNITRQAVSGAKKRKAKTIGGRRVDFWGE